jgi:hypothetical protein
MFYLHIFIVFSLLKMLRINFLTQFSRRGLSLSARCFNKTESEEYTHFGYETVKTEEKAEKGKYAINYVIIIVSQVFLNSTRSLS